jgi:hypothetical protein
MSRSLISVGSPGDHVVCSTGWFWSSQSVASISTGPPSSSTLTRTDGMRASTLAPGHIWPVGMKM